MYCLWVELQHCSKQWCPTKILKFPTLRMGYYSRWRFCTVLAKLQYQRQVKLKLKKNCRRMKILLSLRIRCQFGQAHQMHMYAIHTKDQDNMKSANKYWWVWAVFAINYTYCVLHSIYCLFILLKISTSSLVVCHFKYIHEQTVVCPHYSTPISYFK